MTLVIRTAACAVVIACLAAPIFARAPQRAFRTGVDVVLVDVGVVDRFARWAPFRGILEVGGKKLDTRGERVKNLLAEATDAAFERALEGQLRRRRP